jgi:hypothetical protein
VESYGIRRIGQRATRNLTQRGRDGVPTESAKKFVCFVQRLCVTITLNVELESGTTQERSRTMELDFRCQFEAEDEPAVVEFHEDVLNRFSDSPEFKALEDYGRLPIFLQYAWSHLGETVGTLTPRDQAEILFELFPRKVSCDASVAAAIVAEVRAFWTWLDREFQLPNARACLEALGPNAAADLEKELSNPRNFGMAKSFFMQGREAGFDMTTQQGLNEFLLHYNANLLANRMRAPGSLSPLSTLQTYAEPWETRRHPALAPLSTFQTHAEREQKRKKRKNQRQARKRNR